MPPGETQARPRHWGQKAFALCPPGLQAQRNPTLGLMPTQVTFIPTLCPCQLSVPVTGAGSVTPHQKRAATGRSGVGTGLSFQKHSLGRLRLAISWDCAGRGTEAHGLQPHSLGVGPGVHPVCRTIPSELQEPLVPLTPSPLSGVQLGDKATHRTSVYSSRADAALPCCSVTLLRNRRTEAFPEVKLLINDPAGPAAGLCGCQGRHMDSVSPRSSAHARPCPSGVRRT